MSSVMDLSDTIPMPLSGSAIPDARLETIAFALEVEKSCTQSESFTASRRDPGGSATFPLTNSIMS